MKRLSARLLALGLVVCSVPSNVYAASPTPIVIVREDAVGDAVEAVESPVEARYSSNRISFNGVSGATEYTVEKSESNEDGAEWSVVGTAVQATAAEGEDEADKSYSVVDKTAGKGTKLWYRVTATKGEGVTEEVLAPVQAKHETGADAIHANAEAHYNFVDGPEASEMEAKGMYDASEDLSKIQNLTEGTILMCYKPETGTGREVFFVIKKDNVTVPTAEGNGNGAAMAGNSGLGVFYDATRDKIRFDFSASLKGDWDVSEPIGEWKTFALVSAQDDSVADQRIISALNGSQSHRWNEDRLKRFFNDIQGLTEFTIGGTKGSEDQVLMPYGGKIAYLTITGETLTQDEINKYTEEMKARLIAADSEGEGEDNGEQDPVEASEVTVEARYNSNRIHFGGVEGAKTYTVKRASTEDAADTAWETVGEAITVAGEAVDTVESAYDVVDANAAPGTRYWYKVLAVDADGAEVGEAMQAVQAAHATGVDAVHANAQVHYNFTNDSEGTSFAGDRIVEAEAKDVEAIKDLTAGTILFSHKPAASNERTVILTAKNAEKETAMSGAIEAKSGLAVFREGDGKLRFDFSSTLVDNWNRGGEVGSWHTVAFVSNTSDAAKAAISSIDGIVGKDFTGAEKTGFFSNMEGLSSITVGAAKNGENTVGSYKGEIAYVSISDEVLSLDEINAYTAEMNRLLGLAAPEVAVAAEEDKVVVTLTEATGVTNAVYEISLDGNTWVAVEGTSHEFDLADFTEASTEIKVRVKNGNGTVASATFEKEDAGEENTLWEEFEALRNTVAEVLEGADEADSAVAALREVFEFVADLSSSALEEDIADAKSRLQAAYETYQESLEGDEDPETDELSALYAELETKRQTGLQLGFAQMNSATVGTQANALIAAANAGYAVVLDNGKVYTKSENETGEEIRTEVENGIEHIRQCITAIDEAVAALEAALESQNPLNQIQESLKVHYSFEGLADTVTEIPNLVTGEGADAFNGTLHETSLKVVDEDLAGKALKFTNNANEMLEIPSAMQLNGSYTVGLWVKFDKDLMTSTRTNDLILVQPKVTTSDAGRTHLMVSSDNKLATFMDQTTRKADDTLGGFDKWQHVLISYNEAEGKVTMYQNGASVYENTVTKEKVVKDLSNLYIGRHRTQSGGSYPGSFQGYMDEIVVYNAALNASQVSALYKSNANRRVWPDLAGLITEAEELVEANELGAEAAQTKRLVQILGWIESENITKDSTYDLINSYISTFATAIENYRNASEAPDAPKDLAATPDNAKKEVTLTWTAADGTVTAYEYSDDNGATWKAAGTATTFKVTGLDYNKEYKFQVRAKNGTKASAASNTVTLTLTAPTADKPATPTGLQVVAGDKEVTVSWTAVTGVTYKVQKNGDSSWTNATGSSHKFTGLTNGTEYTFSVKALKDGQESDAATIKGTPAEATQPEKQTVASPAITPASGTYTEAQDVTITCATQGAKIYYTTDGSAPTESSTLYAGKITVSETTTIKAIAVKDGMNDSEVVSVTITINADDSGDPVETKVAAPAFSVQSGTLDKTTEITISSETEGAEIYYTVNGSTPSSTNVPKKAQSIKYTPGSKIKVANSMVIKAVAVKDGMESSDVITVKYDMTKNWIFKDIKSTDGWRYTSLSYTYSTGVMSENGNGTGMFDGEKKLTRGMFATVLYRMAGEPATTIGSKFPDVDKTKYYAAPITWANENGIVGGRPTGDFDPEGNITRAEIAKMLKGYADYCGFDTTAVKDLSTFADGAAIIKKADWKFDALKWATAVGMITGKTKDGKSNLAADDNATRSECAQMISNFAKEYVK